MILEGNQRGGARQLARHLMNTQDNEHVEVYEISGFMSDSVMDAFDEIHAVSRGTKCRQFMFSVSLNPPQDVIAPPEYFEKAIAQIEERTGLTGQPRVIVFHEKEGRRHVHAVWSRIDANEMKAINLPHYKLKLNDISKQLYLEHGWQMPAGLLDKAARDPTTFTLAEWQQAKRQGTDPRLLKQVIQHCWRSSDGRKAFEGALLDHGFFLARGDRRGHVVVDHGGAQAREDDRPLGVIDLSEGGAGISWTLPDRATVGETVRMRFLLAAEQSLDLDARVVRIDEGRAGVAFLPAQQDLVRQLLAESRSDD